MRSVNLTAMFCIVTSIQNLFHYSTGLYAMYKPGYGYRNTVKFSAK